MNIIAQLEEGYLGSILYQNAQCDEITQMISALCTLIKINKPLCIFLQDRTQVHFLTGKRNDQGSLKLDHARINLVSIYQLLPQPVLGGTFILFQYLIVLLSLLMHSHPYSKHCQYGSFIRMNSLFLFTYSKHYESKSHMEYHRKGRP